MNLSRIVFCLLFLGALLNGNSQERIIFRQLGTLDGLSNGSIKSIFQDSDGFIWFGTIGGLNKYDGLRFKVFNYSVNDTQSLSSDDVSCIFQDSKERMWVGTFGGGLNLYNKETDRFRSFQADNSVKGSISSNEINVIFEDSKNQIWIGTENGLNKFNPKNESFLTYTLVPENPYSISSKSVRTIYEDSSGYFWVGTFGGGLNKFDPKAEIFTHYKLDPFTRYSISSDFILDIEPYKNILLIGTNGGGLEVFDPQSGRFENFFNLFSTKYAGVQIIKDIFTDSEGTIWIGTDGEGLFKIIPKENGIKTEYNVSQFLYSNQIKSSLGSNAVYKVFEDNQHNIWIGTAWSGISIIEHSQGNVEFYYSDIEGIDPSPVLSVYTDSKNRIWIGSDGKGLYFYDAVTGEVSNFFNQLSVSSERDYIQVIKEDEKANLWIGTYSNGLSYFNTITKKFITYKNNPSNPNSISNNNVRSILDDKNGNLWVSTWGGGISYFNVSTGEFVNYLHAENNPQSISNNNVLALEAATNGQIWAGTFGGGLNLFNPENGSFTRFQYQKEDSNSISGNNILCLHKDRNENLWIGTWGSGLTKLNIIKQEFTRYDLENGLINNTITAIEEDNNGILWLSTKKGICSLNPETNEINVLNLTRNTRINEFHINSSFKDKEGKIFFGGIEGLICFNPAKLTSTYAPLKVVLTGFELFNKEIAVGENSPLKRQITFCDRIVLNHKQSVFTIKFAALDFPFSDNCQYAVKMDGFETDWRDLGTQNSATYTNLSPGTYTFMVKAKPFNSGWNDEYTQLFITVKPPLMKTWYAFTIYILVFIILLYAFQRYILIWAKLKNNLKLERLKREQESNIHQLKIRFFTNISHEIRTPLTLVLDPLNNLIDSGQGGSVVQQKLRIIRRNADRLLQLINELLDFRRIELGKINIKVAEGNIVKFCHEVFLSFREYAHNHNIAYSFKTADEKLKVWYDRVQMEKVIYNLLSNAFKFTPKNGTISMEVIADNDLVKIVVKDSGEGIPQEQLVHIFERFYQTDGASVAHQSGFGIGLSIARELVELHSGQLVAESEPFKGSSFTIILKTGREHFSEEAILKDHRNSEQIENYQLTAENDEYIDKKTEETIIKSGHTLLIVEDNNDLRSYLCECLSEQYNTIEASNGREGVEKAFELIPDLIVSDIMMPVTDGLELCSKIKSDIRTSHIPVILLTARTTSLYKMEGLETGADDYLTKPFKVEELKIRIKNLLISRKILRERYMKEALMQPKELLITSPDEQFLFNLIEVIENNIDQTEFKVELLSRELNMSHSVIYKKLKALTGQSLVEFIRDIRLKRAAQLLTQNKLSITDICYQVGFTDRKYFSQVFKKKYGKTPSEFAGKKEEN